MNKLYTRVLLALALAAAISPSASAGELKLSIGNGRVTLIAQDVPLRQILAEWSRVGQTRFVNAEKLAGPPLTLQLVDVPEQQALDIVLHSASGYMAAPRPAGTLGASLYDRIMILATSRPPAVSASATPAPFARPPFQQVQPQPADDDDGEPGDQGPVPPPGVMPAGMPQPGMPPATAPGFQPPQQYPGAAQQPGQQVPMTAPKPGMLPAPTPGTPGNPYQQYPQPPVVRKPGGGL
jgi:hypothetical protein